MISFLYILLPLAIILILSASVTKLFKFMIEQSQFIVVCSISLLLIIFGLLGALQIGFYLILAVSAAGLIYLIITKFNFLKIFTPAISIYLLGIMIFSFLVREISLYTHDEVAHWALATKAMYLSGQFYKGLQGMFTATFNYFITKTTFFAASQLYTGAWMLIWSCFILPMGSLRWKNWKRALIYMSAAYCLTGYMIKDVAFHTDELMAFMSSMLAVYWAMQKKKSLIEYVLILIGILSLSQVKESFGPLCAIFVAIFVIVNEIYLNKDNLKKTYPKLIVIILSPVLGLFISLATIEKPYGYYTTGAALELPVLNLMGQSKVFILLSALLIATLVIFFIFLTSQKAITVNKKDIKLSNISAVFLCFIFALFVYKFTMLFLSSMSQDDMGKYVKAWRSFFFSTSGGSTNILTASFIILMIGFANAFATKKEEIKANLTRGIVIVLNILVMGLIVLIAYSTGFDETGMYTASMSWERYTSIPFIIALAFVMGYYILSAENYKSYDKRIIITFLCLVLAVRYIPYPTTITFARYSDARVIFKGIQKAIKEDTDIITKYLNYDDTVFVASYYYEGNANEWGEGRIKWLKYEIAPIKSSWNYNADYDEVIGSTGNLEQHASFIGQYDYLYVQSAGPEYYEKFGILFPDGKYYYSNALYKVEYFEGELILTSVYLDDSRLLP